MRRLVYHWKKTETYRSSLIPFSSIGKKGVISTTMMTIFLERLFLSSCRKISFFSNNRGETLRLIPYSYFTRLVLGSKEEFIVVFQYCVAICQQIWKTQQWPQDWKRSLFIPIPKKGNAKECSNYSTIALISHASKVMLKILQARLQQYVTQELPDVQTGFRKGIGTRKQTANICWIIEKAREFQKKHLFLLY